MLFLVESDLGEYNNNSEQRTSETKGTGNVVIGVGLCEQSPNKIDERRAALAAPVRLQLVSQPASFAC